MDSTPVRRSGRIRVPNKKYAEDIRDFSPEPEPELSGDAPRDSGEDEEFDVGAVEEAEDDVAQDEDSDPSVRTPVEDEDDDEDDDSGSVEVISVDPFRKRSATKRSKVGKSVRKPQAGEEYHVRGYLVAEKSITVKNQVAQLAGHDEQDAEPLRKAVFKWESIETLPTRAADKNGAGGMAHHPSYTTKKRRDEMESWEWYDKHQGGIVMRKHQRLQPIKPKDARQFYPRFHDQHRFLYGPFDKQVMYHLSPMQAASLDHLWRTGLSDIDERSIDNAAEDDKRGWIINLGARPRCMAWTPKLRGDRQFLAISTFKHPPFDQRDRSAFAPIDKTPACVQIWSFTSSKRTSGYRSMDVDNSPKLVHAICTEWGPAVQLEWNPAARDPPQDQESEIWLGLLAGVWRDGFVRVLDIRIPRETDEVRTHGKSIFFLPHHYSYI